jgi:DNA mismatch endonuclease, patch repair protein
LCVWYLARISLESHQIFLCEHSDVYANGCIIYRVNSPISSLLTMTDIFSKSKRSDIMRRVRQKHSRPEIAVRRAAHSLGYRYRLHVDKLPGQPDVVFAGRHKVIFVHGCFWHGHGGRCKKKLPVSNVEYWKAKIIKNRRRDRKNIKELQLLGWDVLVIWECETSKRALLETKLTTFLG